MKKILLILALMSIFLVGCTKSEESRDNTTVNESNIKEESLEENLLAGSELIGFNTKDVYGNDVDENIFKNNELTILNLWGTFCGPCIDEMPDLEKISNEYEDKNVKVLGIVIDDPSAEDAVKLLEKLGVTYTNIFPDEKLKELVTSKFDYVPVTLFVDSDGKVLKTFIAGSEDRETFKRIIDKIIEEK